MRAQASPTVGPVLFKQGMRALVGGVAVVTAYDASGASLGLTATSVSSLSVDPPRSWCARQTPAYPAMAQRAPPRRRPSAV